MNPGSLCAHAHPVIDAEERASLCGKPATAERWVATGRPISLYQIVDDVNDPCSPRGMSSDLFPEHAATISELPLALGIPPDEVDNSMMTQTFPPQPVVMLDDLARLDRLAVARSPRNPGTRTA
jgi:hypothetical protein